MSHGRITLHSKIEAATDLIHHLESLKTRPNKPSDHHQRRKFAEEPHKSQAESQIYAEQTNTIKPKEAVSSFRVFKGPGSGAEKTMTPLYASFI